MFTNELQKIMFRVSKLAPTLQRRFTRLKLTTIYGTIAISVFIHLAATMVYKFAPGGIRYRGIGLTLTLSLDLGLFGHTIWLKSRHYQSHPGPETTESKIVKTLRWHRLFGLAMVGALVVVIIGCGLENPSLLQYPFLVSTTLAVSSYDNLLTLLRR